MKWLVMVAVLAACKMSSEERVRLARDLWATESKPIADKLQAITNARAQAKNMPVQPGSEMALGARPAFATNDPANCRIWWIDQDPVPRVVQKIATGDVAPDRSGIEADVKSAVKEVTDLRYVGFIREVRVTERLISAKLVVFDIVEPAFLGHMYLHSPTREGVYEDGRQTLQGWSDEKYNVRPAAPPAAPSEPAPPSAAVRPGPPVSAQVTTKNLDAMLDEIDAAWRKDKGKAEDEKRIRVPAARPGIRVLEDNGMPILLVDANVPFAVIAQHLGNRKKVKNPGLEMYTDGTLEQLVRLDESGKELPAPQQVVLALNETLIVFLTASSDKPPMLARVTVGMP